MNIFKWILMTALIHGCFCNGVQAQTVKKTLEFNNGWGTEYRQNYVKNPSARKSSQTNVTYSNFNASIGSGNIEGTNGFDLNATATSGYGEWAVNPFDDEDKVGNCVFTGYSKGTAANYKAQIVDGSGAELAFIQLQTTTDWTPYSVVYPCGATGARKVRMAYTSTGTGAVFNAGRFTYRKFDDIPALDGTSFFGGMEQVAGTGCNYPETTSSGTTNFIAMGASTCAQPWVSSASNRVISIAATNHRAVLVTPPNAYYDVTITSNFYRSGGGMCLFRLNDGTNTYQAQGNFGTAAAMSNILKFTVYVPSQMSTNLTLTLEASDDQTGCSIDNTNLGGVFSWKVVKLPGNGLAYSNAIPASLADSPAISWTTGMTIGATTTAPVKGTTTDDRIGYALQGIGAYVKGEYKQTATGSSTAGSGDYLFTLPGGLRFATDTKFFTTSIGYATIMQTPTGIGTAQIANVSNSGTGFVLPYDATRFRIFSVISNGSAANITTLTSSGFSMNQSALAFSFEFWAPMEGRVPTANAMLFGGMVYSNATSPIRVETLFGVCGSSSSITRQSTPGVFSVGNITSGGCNVSWPVGTWSSAPTCTVSANNVSTNKWIVNLESDATTTGTRTYGFTGGSDLTIYGFTLDCKGPK